MIKERMLHGCAAEQRGCQAHPSQGCKVAFSYEEHAHQMDRGIDMLVMRSRQCQRARQQAIGGL